MPLFGRRRPPDPLGEGVWRRAHDRYHRAVDRAHQVLDGVPAGAAHDGLTDVANLLATLVGDVRAVCERAQADAPSSGVEVPGGSAGRYLDAHRALSRAGTMAAQAAEAAVLTRVALASGDAATADERVSAARRAATASAEQVAVAGRLVAQDRPPVR